MYNSYFGFNDKPFNITPNPRFFYANRSYEEAYANLLYGIRERKGFLLLTGEVGTGKTTILQKLMGELDTRVPFVFFYTTTLTFEDLLTHICDELGLIVKSQSQLGRIQALNDFLLAQLRQGSTAALLIDEAQNLREDVFENLRLLSNLETPREKLLQIVLCGQPELEAKLEQPGLRQVRQRISLQWRLDGLRADEVGAFINCRLKAVNYGRNDLFSQDAVREIARYSQGIPRLVNIICDNALLITYADSKKNVSAEIIKEVAKDLRLGIVNRAPGVQTMPFAAPFNGAKQERGREGSMLPIEPMRAAGYSNRLTEDRTRPAGGVTPGPTLVRPRTDLMPQFLDILTRELTDVMGPMAPFVVRSHLRALGDTLHALPSASCEKLVELVSPEILNEMFRVTFKQRMSAVIGVLNTKRQQPQPGGKMAGVPGVKQS
jgi:general secretion pathway protein A